MDRSPARSLARWLMMMIMNHVRMPLCIYLPIPITTLLAALLLSKHRPCPQSTTSEKTGDIAAYRCPQQNKKTTIRRPQLSTNNTTIIKCK